MRARTAIVLIVISLAAVAGVAYGAYRASEKTDDVAARVSALEQASSDSAREIDALKADKRRLCAQVDRVREKITGVVLAPGSPEPNFDIGADPLSAPERTILMLYNWCQAP